MKTPGISRFYSTKLSVLCMSLFIVGSVNLSFGQESINQVATGQFFEVTIAAPSLEGNLLGEPTRQPISIYLPPSYDTSPGKRYPVIYLLHGFTGSNRTWMVDSELQIGEPPPGSTDIGYGYNVKPILDSLIAEGKIREMIVVAPSTMNSYKHAYFINSSTAGNWEDYLIKDVLSYVDGNYRTLATATSRGITGHSGGGSSAVYVGMRHPDIFSIVYAMAACCLGNLGGFSLELTEGLDPFYQKIFRRLANLTSKDQLPLADFQVPEDFFLNTTLSSAAVFSPNPNRPPLYADYLYELEDGQLVKNESAIDRFKEHTPLFMIDEYKQNLLSLRGLFLGHGELEIPLIVNGNALFSKALADRSIPHTFEIYAGGDHNNLIKERLETRVFPYFSDLLDF